MNARRVREVTAEILHAVDPVGQAVDRAAEREPQVRRRRIRVHAGEQVANVLRLAPGGEVVGDAEHVQFDRRIARPERRNQRPHPAREFAGTVGGNGDAHA